VGEFDCAGVCNGDDTSCQTASLSLGAFDSSGSLEVLYDFGSAVAGFQFDVSGLAFLADGLGGAAGDAGFDVQTGGSTILGFSFEGETIHTVSRPLPAGIVSPSNEKPRIVLPPV
jgi:hypothetical protein